MSWGFDGLVLYWLWLRIWVFLFAFHWDEVVCYLWSFAIFCFWQTYFKTAQLSLGNLLEVQCLFLCIHHLSYRIYFSFQVPQHQRVQRSLSNQIVDIHCILLTNPMSSILGLNQISRSPVQLSEDNSGSSCQSEANPHCSDT